MAALNTIVRPNHMIRFEERMPTMKKTIAILTAATMSLSLAACGSTGTGSGASASEADYRIAIVQQLDHSSLD